MTESASRPELVLTARLNASAADARRGVVRLHPEVLAALGIREWDAIALVGSRRTASVAGRAPANTPHGTALLDDVTLSNAGIKEDGSIAVTPVSVQGARTVTIAGSALATGSISDATLRQALLGKVIKQSTQAMVNRWQQFSLQITKCILVGVPATQVDLDHPDTGLD